MRELAGKAAAVTGAGSGIGRALALRLAGEGMDLALADVQPAPLAETRELVRARGVRVLSRVTDVGEEREVAAFADQAFAELGAVHPLAGLFVGPGSAPYTVSKWAAFAATLSLAQELAMQGSRIGVSALCPGGVTTRIHESERVRPAALSSEPGPDSSFMNDMIKATVENGISPEEVAGQVVEAVRTGRFLVLTHPAYAEGLPAQAAALIAGRLPAMPDFEWRG